VSLIWLIRGQGYLCHKLERGVEVVTEAFFFPCLDAQSLDMEHALKEQLEGLLPRELGDGTMSYLSDRTSFASCCQDLPEPGHGAALILGNLVDLEALCEGYPFGSTGRFLGVVELSPCQDGRAKALPGHYKEALKAYVLRRHGEGRFVRATHTSRLSFEPCVGLAGAEAGQAAPVGADVVTWRQRGWNRLLSQ
jgi:hypothetical protein